MFCDAKGCQVYGRLVSMAVLVVVVSIAAGEQTLSGLRGQYFRDEQFKSLAWERVDPGIDYGEEIPSVEPLDDHFSIRWTGQLRIHRDGEYTFRAKADDSVRVWLGETLILDTRDDATVRLTKTTVRLEEQWLPLRVDYVNDGGGHRMTLYWDGPRFDEQPIGLDHLRTAPWVGMDAYALEAMRRDGRGKRVKRKPGWRGRYYHGENFEKLVHEQRDPRIHYVGRYPFPDGRDEEFSVRWTGTIEVERSGTYTFYPATDNGGRLWIDYRLVHEDWKGGGLKEHKVKVELEGGRHPIMFEHRQGGGDRGAILQWSGPRIDKTLLDGRFVSTRVWESMKDPRPFVILFGAGHSNMEGRARSARKGPADRAWLYDGDGGWEAAGEDMNGPMWPLMHELMKRYPGVDFGVVKVARSAARIKERFLPGKREYRELVEDLKRARLSGRLVGGVIMQGWGNVERTKTAEEVKDFPKHYRKFVRSLREDLGRDDLPIIASQVEYGSDVRGHEEAWKAVHDHIAALPKGLDQLAVVDANGIDMVDGHHFSGKGNEAWAKLALKAVNRLKMLDELDVDRRSRDDEPVKLPSRVESPKTVLAEADLKLQKRTEGRSRDELGTYRNLLVVNEYKVRKIRSGALPSDRVLVVEFAVRNGKPGPARKLKEGQRRRLKLRSWRAQKKFQSLPMDDDINDFDAPLFFATGG
jgi:hypothetical protein